MISLDLSDFAIATALKETVRIDRQGDITCVILQEIAAAEEMVILPSDQPDIILGTGQVLNTKPDFDAYLISPNTSINKGDIITRSAPVDPANRKLFVNGIWHIANIMKLDLVKSY